ncbi:MAG: 2-oxoisovalerate dehydrogenase E1 component [Patiriisocius sp.]|jgi:2-oxoisovalerate dehydrogenase E1 component
MSTTEELQYIYTREGFDDALLVKMYKSILLPRLIEEKMLILLRSGKISKWFSGIGQEAISVGATMAIEEDEFILPMHRNLGVFTTRNIPLNRLFSQFQGKETGFTSGRDRSFHFGSKEHHIVGMISHLGSQLGVADGIGLGSLLNDSKKVTVAFSGDGGTSQGDFHESLNVAAVWNLPVIFIVENNGYGLSTPSDEQFKCKQFIDKGIGYGMETCQIAGNNILEVYSKIKSLAVSIRENPRPVLVECVTFRMRGHEEASGVKYVPKSMFTEWAKKDPVGNLESFLRKEKLIDDDKMIAIRSSIKQLINEQLDIAYEESDRQSDIDRELGDVFMTSEGVVVDPQQDSKSEKRMVDAISDGLRQSMERHDNLVLMGQDIAEYGGVFKITEGFVEQFGKDRVRNTPLCEAAIVGSSLGLSIQGYKVMMEMQFADFVTEGFNQIINNLAKIHYRWGQNADVVIRMPTGAGVGAGPFHSQSNEAWFTHTPGLIVLYPAFASDAKGLLAAAIENPNPVMFFEHKALYRSQKEMVHDDYYTLPIGKANVLREGDDVTIVTYGMGVHWAIKVLDDNPNISADLIDLRSLVPLDEECIFESVRKTGRVLILHEDNMYGGIGGELSALISEHCFESLDAPIKRVASLDTPVPFSSNLEEEFLANFRLEDELLSLIGY